VSAEAPKETSIADELYVTTSSELPGDVSGNRVDDEARRFRLTKGGRWVLIAMLLIGVVGYWFEFAYVNPHFRNTAAGVVWSIKYRGDINAINQAVIEAEPDFATSNPNWHAITVDCANIRTALNSLTLMSDYPVAGPDKNLLTGANEVAVAAQTCDQTVIPNLNSGGLPELAGSFRSGSYQLKLFLNEIPSVF
jgi:hypothetical protein